MGYPVDPELGWYYVVSVAGEVEGINYEVGDWIVWNGTSWDKLVGLAIKVIDGANSEENAVKIGDGVSILDLYAKGGHVNVYQEGSSSGTEWGHMGFGVTISVYQRPSGDGVPVDWGHSQGPLEYQDIDDLVVQPDSGDGYYICEITQGAVQTFELSEVNGMVYKYTVWICGRTEVGAVSEKTVRVHVDYNDGAGWNDIGVVSFPIGESKVYESIMVAGVHELGVGWKMKLTVDNNIVGKYVYVYVVYLDVEYSILKPFNDVYARKVIDDDGTLGSYSVVDDLQLLRNLREWNVRDKIININFPEYIQKVWDKDTLPWVVAHPNVNAMEITNNDKRYQSTLGQKIGYILSVMKKILEVVDALEGRVKELGG